MMKKAGSLLGTILDLGEQLLISGAEVWRVEEILKDLFEAYCFRKADIWITSACIQATVQTWDERVYTQIRSVDSRSYDLDKLQRLFALVDEVCETPTGIGRIREKLNTIMEQPGLSDREKYLATVIGAVGFTILYGGGASDIIVAIVNGLILNYLSINLNKRMNNFLAGTIVSAFVMEIVALAAMAGGITDQIAPVTISGIFFLISGIGLANGIGELMHSNTLSGLMETSSAVLGAFGIAIGITLAILPFRSSLDSSQLLQTAVSVPNPVISIAACTLGCLGFAFLMGTRGKALIYAGIGSALTQCVYSFVELEFGGSSFTATLQGAFFLAIFAIVIHKITKIPGVVIRIACILPLVPGSNLYYTVLGAITADPVLFKAQGGKMLLIAAGIALGYIAVDVAERLANTIYTKYTGRM